MEKTTLGLVDFRIPRVIFASPGDLKILRFNCITKIFYLNLLFHQESSLEWHTGSVHCIAHVFIMSLNKKSGFSL